MLILECSQGCYGMTDGSVTISLRNFFGEGTKTKEEQHLLHQDIGMNPGAREVQESRVSYKTIAVLPI